MQAKYSAYRYRFSLLLIILFTLNMSDFIFSYIGLKIGFIEEANPIMAYLYNRSFLAFLLCKLLLPSFLIYIISRMLRFCENTQLIGILVYAAISVYGTINAYHIWWFLHQFI